MSESDERSALDHPGSLFQYAQRLIRLHPDEKFPDSSHLLPHVAGYVPTEERQLTLTAVVQEFIDNPALSAQDLHDRCVPLRVQPWDTADVLRKITSDAWPRLLSAARWLISNGTVPSAVVVGLGLLGGRGDPSDIPALTTIGRLRFADRLAVEALAAIPGAEHDLIRLADRSHQHARIQAVEQLVACPDAAVRSWVRATPRELLASDLARKIAEQHALSELLDDPDVTDGVWEQTGNLLLAMTDTDGYRSEISRYEPALSVYQRWVALAERIPPTLDRAALLAMIAEDLRTGPAAPVVGELRSGLVDQIERVLSSQPWTQMLARSAASGDPIETRRAEWITARADAQAGRFVVRVVVPDPNPVGFPVVEARIVIDGMPVVAAAFDKGPAKTPEHLLHSGLLRATGEPREVMLAEAYCTEGCCGGLYVTIVREGGEVVWKDWRSSTQGDLPPQARFDAAEYDREITRAEQDHSWEWPARTLARLLTEEFRADPAILGRWECAFESCWTNVVDGDTVRLSFHYPVHIPTHRDPVLYFAMVVDLHGRDPATLAAEIIESARTTDPKTTVPTSGGSRELAEKLGITYHEPTWL